MESKCAWCGREKEMGGGKIDGKVSHGICVACALGLKKEAQERTPGKVSLWKVDEMVDRDRDGAA